MINETPPFLLWLKCHDIWLGVRPIELPQVTFNSIQNSPDLPFLILKTALISGNPKGVTASILVRVILLNLFFILFQNFVSGFVVIYNFITPFD